MNIKELKDLIKDLPDEMPVVVDGYEGGMKTVERTSLIDIYKYGKGYSEGVYGEFVSDSEMDGSFDHYLKEENKHKLRYISKAFYISRDYLHEYIEQQRINKIL